MQGNHSENKFIERRKGIPILKTLLSHNPLVLYINITSTYFERIQYKRNELYKAQHRV